MENGVNDDLLTVKEACEILNLSKYQVYRRIVRGDIPARQEHRGNVQYLMTRADVEKYKAAAETGAVTAPKIANVHVVRVSEAATMTGYSVETIRRLCYEGALPFIRGAGERGHLRIPRSAVEEMMQHIRN